MIYQGFQVNLADQPDASNKDRCLRVVDNAFIDYARMAPGCGKLDYTRQPLTTDSRDALTISRQRRSLLTISDLGWTRDQALAIRGQLASFAEDWDDPAMDVYDEL